MQTLDFFTPSFSVISVECGNVHNYYYRHCDCNNACVIIMHFRAISNYVQAPRTVIIHHLHTGLRDSSQRYSSGNSLRGERERCQIALQILETNLIVIDGERYSNRCQAGRECHLTRKTSCRRNHKVLSAGTWTESANVNMHAILHTQLIHGATVSDCMNYSHYTIFNRLSH